METILVFHTCWLKYQPAVIVLDKRSESNETTFSCRYFRKAISCKILAVSRGKLQQVSENNAAMLCTVVNEETNETVLISSIESAQNRLAVIVSVTMVCIRSMEIRLDVDNPNYSSRATDVDRKKTQHWGGWDIQGQGQYCTWREGWQCNQWQGPHWV